MFILVNPNTAVLIKITDECIPILNNKGDNIECKDEKATAYLSNGLIYPKSLPLQMYKVEEIPDGVVPYKYLYTKKDGFMVNTNYKEPEDIYTSLSSVENELVNMKSNIDSLDEVNVKTNKSKILDTILYLGSNNYYINNKGNTIFNTLSVSSTSTFKDVVYFGDDNKYYIGATGSAKFETLTISDLKLGTSFYIDFQAKAKLYSLDIIDEANLYRLSVEGSTNLNGVIYTNNIIYFNSNETTKYYIGATGSASFNGLSVASTSTFTGNATFKGNAYFGNTTYYVYSNGTAKFASVTSAGAINVSTTLNVGTTSTFTGNATFKGNAYFGNTTYYVYSSGVANFSTTTVSTLKIGKSGTTSVYSYLYHPLMFGNSSNYWINQNGNAILHALKVQDTLTINATSYLNAQLTMGSDKSSNTDKYYYINGYGNGSFNGVWVDTLLYYKGGAASSKRYKCNIEYRDTDYWHDRLMQVKPCTFNYKNHSKDDISIGVIAEDLIELFPELVELDENGNCEMVRTPELVNVLISEAQRSNKIIENMQKEINELKNIINNTNV